MTRRDMCYFIGRRVSHLSGERAEAAWRSLGRQLERLAEKDVPKFLDLLVAIRAATAASKQLVENQRKRNLCAVSPDYPCGDCDPCISRACETKL